EVQGFKLSLLRARRANDSEHVFVIVSIKNVSAKDRPWVATHPLRIYAFNVTRGADEPAALTALGKARVEAAQEGSRATATVKPGETRGAEFFLDRIYDMSLPGEYKVTVSTSVPKLTDAAGFEKITSNEIIIKVQAAADEAKLLEPNK